MTLYRVQFIELNGDEDEITNGFVTKEQYRELLAVYKRLKGIR